MPAKLVRIHSENGDYQRIFALHESREKRQKHHAFVVESVKAIELAVQSGCEFSALLYARERPLSEWARRMLASARAERHLELPLELLAKLSDKNETSELVGVAQVPADDLARITLRPPLLVVVLDRPSSPGNLGTVLRTCDALGASGVVITGHAVDLYDPKTVRASLGTLFTVPVVRSPSSKELEPWLLGLKREHGATIVGTSAKSELDVGAHDFTQPTVLLLGNETTGLSAHYRSLCDHVVTIPIHGAASSLNVACAAAIALYEIDRQRRAARNRE